MKVWAFPCRQLARMWSALGILGVVVAPSLCAQGVRSTSRAPVASSRGILQVTGCAGQTISDIVILAQPPFAEKLPEQVEFVRTTARALHATTKSSVILRYLLLHVGEPCDQIKRAESVRILSAQPFIVDAKIQVYDDNKGGVRLEVETRDEFTAILEPHIEAKAPMFRGARIGEGNLLGSANRVALEWRDGVGYQDLYALQYTDYQFVGDRNELRLLARRGERDQTVRLEVVRPYYTDLQRFAWIASVGGSRDYSEFLRPGHENNAVNVARQFANVGALTRVGPVGRLRLVGAMLTREFAHSDSMATLLHTDGFRPDSGGIIPVAFRRKEVTRADALLGMRRIRFARVEGFDALTGSQDLRVGVQSALVLGQSVPLFQSHDKDRFVAGDIYAGYGGQSSFVGMQAKTEARYDRDRSVWDGIVTSARVAWYAKPSSRQLTLSQIEFGAGYNMQSPFQVSFADYDGGLIGYRDSRQPGAQRLVVRAEHRVIIPTRYNFADGGVALFAEAGKLWSSSTAPYTLTTPVRGTVGLSLLAAIPPRSRKLWRIDFGMPVGNDPRRKFEVRFSSTDKTRVFWREPDDVLQARERTRPASLFTWP